MPPKIEYLRGWLPSPPIVLLPGLFAGAWIWKPAWDHLSALGYSLLQISEPFAAIDTHKASIDVLREMLVAALDEHAISRAVLCGNSLGGLVALDTAWRRPDRVESVLISGCPGFAETASLGLCRNGDMSRQVAVGIAGQLFYDRSAISDEMFERSYLVARDRRCAGNMLRYILAIRKYDLRKCLPHILCQVLLVWGDCDRIAPVEDWELNLHLIARTSLHKLARCEHSPMIERPDEFNAILTAFLVDRGPNARVSPI